MYYIVHDLIVDILFFGDKTLTIKVPIGTKKN